MKDEMGGKIVTKSGARKHKTNGCKVQKDDYELEESEFIKAKGVKKLSI